jgi:RNA polymerase sigma-70 factor, ECF subfamily
MASSDGSFACSDAARVFPVVYQELRRLAGHYMQQERPGQSLQPTALVHEAYMRLADAKVPIRSRPEFFAVAGRAMRQILVDHARARHAARRGGRSPKVSLEESTTLALEDPEVVLNVDLALTKLESIYPDLAQIVELRVFIGFTVEEAAEALGKSERTLKRQWSFARSFLTRELAL